MSRYLGCPLLGGVTVEGYQQGALRMQPIIALFKERFKTISLRKSNWYISLVLTVIYLPLNFCSSLLVEDYKWEALRKKLIITPLVQQFKTSPLRMFY